VQSQFSYTSNKGIATLSAAETQTSAVAKNVKVPALVVVGLIVCITQAKTIPLTMYDGLNNKSQHNIRIKGGSHCLMAGSSYTCCFGEGTCKPYREKTQEEQYAIINTYLIPRLNYYLKQ
jgi:hypothetical protein